MTLDVAAVQRALRAEGVDAWVLYDFHGSNPIAARLAGLTGGGHMTTRRWFYVIPADGAPRGLVHAIERHNLDALPGDKVTYAGRLQFEAGLDRLLDGLRRVAMEYSPECAIPYLSRLDAGTAESLRRRGLEIVASGDLVQRFEASWDEDQLQSHRAASEALYRQGEALLKLGPNFGKAAEKAFDRVVKEYPDSRRAEDARQQLKLLGAG